MDDRDGNTGEQPERDEALLAVAESVVFVGEGQPVEDDRHIREVEPVPAEVQPSLAFRPGELAWHIVYTFRKTGQRIVGFAMRG